MRRLVAIVVVLIVLFVVADRISVHYVQGRVADDLRQTERLTSQPSVTIHGFPFLTQLLGKLSDVEVVVHDFRRGDAIDISKIDVHLRDADVPLNDDPTVPVGHVDATVLLSYRALSSVHQGLTFGYAGGNRLRVTGSVTVGGVQVTTSASGHVDLAGNALSVGIDGVDTGSAAAADAIDVVRRVFGVRTPLPVLPFHFRLTSARATAAGIEVRGSADNVVLRLPVG